MTEHDALLRALEWLDNIRSLGQPAIDIMIDAQPKDTGLLTLRRAVQPSHIGREI